MRVLLASPLVAALLLVAAAGATSTDRPAGASASAYAIRVIAPTGTVGTQTLTSPPDRVQFSDGGFAYPSDGSVVSAKSYTGSASSDSGDVAIAASSSSATSVSLFNGEITAAAVAAKAAAKANASDASGAFDGTGVSGLVVLGAASSGGSVQLADWGTLTTGIESGAPTSGGPPGWKGYSLALDVRLTADHGGLPAGSEIQIGYAEVSAQAAKPAPLPTAPTTVTTSGGGPKPGPKGAPEPKQTGIPGPLKTPPKFPAPKLTAGGYVFPVYGQVSFVDTFGSFRGDVPGNWHHGDDIFAPLGAPILSVATGTVFSVGWNDVGGNRLWLRDRQGNEFYYAHLSAFSPLAKNGAQVQAGDVVGFVGNTGDATGTPYHLHFEVHPVAYLGYGYDGAVDPTAFLMGWQRLQDVRFDAAAGWAPAPVTDARAPKPGAILLQVSDISSASGLDPGSLQRAIAPAAMEGDGGLLHVAAPPSH